MRGINLLDFQLSWSDSGFQELHHWSRGAFFKTPYKGLSECACVYVCVYVYVCGSQAC